MTPPTDAVEIDDPHACARCNEPVDHDVHWVSIEVTHHGAAADRYRDLSRKLCVDCLAAIGLLAFPIEEGERR